VRCFLSTILNEILKLRLWSGPLALAPGSQGWWSPFAQEYDHFSPLLCGGHSQHKIMTFTFGERKKHLHLKKAFVFFFSFSALAFGL
jgi:hypothetical protein